MSKTSVKAKHETVFSKEYSKLNPLQKKAVDTIEGPVMVFAGPGTGKTQTLAMRIANILKSTDVSPHNILAVTFTESGTKAMRERLLSIIGESAYYVNISTFHAFCSEVIQSHPEHFSFSSAAEPISDLDRFSLIQSIILSSSFEAIKPVNSPLYYVFECLKAIQNLKRENVSESSFREMIHAEESMLKTVKISATERKKRETYLQKNKELLEVYILYQKGLKESNRYDFEDMISLTIETFLKDPELLQTYQERIQYILVDEYQDTNTAQNTLIKLLASYWGEHANIFVVGDSDQSLYRFQGASLENSLEFIERFPHAEVITLKENYRSTQSILDASYELIQKNTYTLENFTKKHGEKKIEGSLHSQSYEKTKGVSIVELSSYAMELSYVAKSIKDLIDSGVLAKEIAVIYRNNKDSIALQEILKKWDIEFSIDGGVNVLSSPVIQQLLTLFSILQKIRKREEGVELFTLLSYEWVGCDPLDILKLSRFAAVKKLSIFETILKYPVKDMELSHPEKILDLVSKFEYWSQLDGQKTFPEWFEVVINESGYMPWLLEKNHSIAYLNQLQSLFSLIKHTSQENRTYNLDQFMFDVSVMIENNIEIPEEHLNFEENVVHLTTAHRSKGLEWDHVFIIHALDKKWGNQIVRELIHLPDEIIRHTNISEKEKNEDERRVFYVALTRARKSICISYAKTSSSTSKSKDTFPSMFIEEIPKEQKIYLDTKKFESEIQKHIKTILSVPTQPDFSKEEQVFLSKLVDSLVLTPTALNTYIDCGYKFKLNTLIKVPRAKADYLAFGTAIHKALEILHKYLLEHDLVPPKEFVISEFEKALYKEVLTKDDYEKRFIQGGKVLSKYYDEYKDSMKKALFIEKFFGYGWSKIYLDDIALGGRIDKIEWDDEKQKKVIVVDYKTGQPKSRNEIEGKVGKNTGGYKRQLVFYKLLTDLDTSFQLKVEKGLFDFIEPVKASGAFKREEFTITKEDVEELRQIIIECMKKIRNLEFKRTTDTSLCEMCEFKHHCFPEGIPKIQHEQLQLI